MYYNIYTHNVFFITSTLLEAFLVFLLFYFFFNKESLFYGIAKNITDIILLWKIKNIK